MSEQVRCGTLAETQELARQIAPRLRGGDVVALTGDLGAGKTTFVRAIAEALGVLHPEEVLSPTYAIMHVYPLSRVQRGATEILHLDLYRLDDRDAFDALGVGERIGESDTISFVEWADRFVISPDPTFRVHVGLEGHERSFLVRPTTVAKT